MEHKICFKTVHFTVAWNSSMHWLYSGVLLSAVVFPVNVRAECEAGGPLYSQWVPEKTQDTNNTD